MLALLFGCQAQGSASRESGPNPLAVRSESLCPTSAPNQRDPLTPPPRVQYELMDRVRERMRGGGVVPSASGQTDNSARNRGCLLRPTLTRPAGPPLHNASLPLSALRLHRATTKSSQTGLRPYGPATPWTASTSGRTTMRSGSGGCSAGCDACFSSTTSTAPLLAGRC